MGKSNIKEMLKNKIDGFLSNQNNQFEYYGLRGVM